MEPVVKPTGTHPLLTVSFYGAIVIGLVMSGSYVSKQRSVERELAAAELAAHGPAVVTMTR